MKYGDIQVSSTGSPKIVNVENGGFINDITGKVELNKHLLKTLKADNITCAAISHEITKAVEIEEKTIESELKNISFFESGKNLIMVFFPCIRFSASCLYLISTKLPPDSL